MSEEFDDEPLMTKKDIAKAAAKGAISAIAEAAVDAVLDPD